MKGMLDFLEKAGLVRQDATVDQGSPADAEPVAQRRFAPAATAAAGSGAAPTLQLDEIYANAGVATSPYPAERLLRVVDGLKEMDEATRSMAIRAIDAADESWTITDPLDDAVAKVKALNAHAEQIQLNLRQLEQETAGRLEALRLRQEKVVGDIRKQMAELEALASRELTRGAQESAAQEANLKLARDQASRELGELAQVSQRLQGLVARFGAPAAKPQG